MKINFLGAGALGCAIGGTLAASGSDVTLIDPYQAHVDAINRDGLRMRRGEDESVVRVKAATSIDGLRMLEVLAGNRPGLDELGAAVEVGLHLVQLSPPQVDVRLLTMSISQLFKTTLSGATPGEPSKKLPVSLS